MHSLGVTVTFVPDFPGETIARSLSVIGLLARARRACCVLPLLLGAAVSIMFGREAELANMDSAAIAPAGPILTIVSITYLTSIRCRRIDEASS